MIVGLEDLPVVRNSHPEETIALKTGCYDIVHDGHLRGLEFAKQQASLLVIGIWPDSHVAGRKGPERPIIPQQARAGLIGALAMVDYVLIMPEGEDTTATPPMLQVVTRLRPNVFVLPRHAFYKPPHENDAKIQAMGAEIIYDMAPPTNSTTSIVRRVLERYGQATA